MPTQQATLQASILHAVCRWLRERRASVSARLVAGTEARRTERELAELSDHLLRDIGLRRDEIARVSRPARGL